MSCRLRDIYNRKKRFNSDGTAPVTLYVSYNRIKKYINTGVYVRPEEWDEKKGLIGKKHLNHIHLNALLRRKKADLQDWFYEHEVSGKPVNIKDLTFDHGSSRLTFYGFSMQDLEKDTLAPNTRRVYLITLNAFNEFAPGVALSGVTREIIENFEYHLKRQGLHPNTIHRYLRQIRRFLNRAEAQEYIIEKQNPFHKKRLHKVKTEPKYLDPEIIDKLVDLEFNQDEQHLDLIRDLFLFSVYSGLRYSDLMGLKKEEVYKNDSGYYIHKLMQKTLNRKMNKVYIPLWIIFNGAAEELVDKYYSDERVTVFPHLTNEHINRELKRIWQKLGLAQTYTFHSARHTCATYLLYKGVNIKIVQKILGHEDLKTTEVYANVLRKTIDNELERVNW